MSRRPLVPGVVLWMALSASLYGERVRFEIIPGALGANDMTSDGRYVVGETGASGVATGTYRWDTATNDFQTLPPLGLSAVAVSEDGKVVVGDIPDPMGVGTEIAARWTAATGWVGLGHLPNANACPSLSNSYDVSADGSVVVGLSWDGCSGRGFRWEAGTGMQELQNLANGNNRASVVSADGTRIGGFAQGSFSRTPAIWDETLAGELLDPAGDDLGEISGMREDGSVLLGEYAGPSDTRVLATKWNSTPTGWQRETVSSGSLLPGWAGTALDIADDNTIVGFDFLLGNRRGWIQPGGTGPLVPLRTYVESNGGTVPSGAILEVPQAISSDGRYIIGHGFGTGAWRITVSSDCDFDTNGVCNIVDLDSLVTAIVSMSNDSEFDLTDDGLVNGADRDAWLAQAGSENLPSGNPYLLGDVNLDGAVDGSDFNTWNGHKFTSTGAWSMGDFNVDGATDGADFNLWNLNKFTSAAVPEPAHCLLWFVLGAARFLTPRKVKIS